VLPWLLSDLLFCLTLLGSGIEVRQDPADQAVIEQVCTDMKPLFVPRRISNRPDLQAN